MRAGRRLRGWLRGSWRPKPVAAWEYTVMRVAFVPVVFWKLPAEMNGGSQPFPNGLARWIDFGWLGEPAAYSAVKAVMLAAGVAFALGWWLPLSASVLALGHLSICTLLASQSPGTHFHQIISQVLLAQALTAIWLSIHRRVRGTVPGGHEGLTPASWLLYFAQGVVVVGYVTSAVTKLHRSAGLWLTDLPKAPLALIRTHTQAHYTNPVGEPPPLPSMAVWFIEHPTWTTLIFAPGLFLELFAFLALWNRAFSSVMGLGLIALHRGIALIMALYFPLNELCLLIFFVNLPWWLWALRMPRQFFAIRNM